MKANNQLLINLINRITWVLCLIPSVILFFLHEDVFFLFLITGLIVKWTLFPYKLIAKSLSQNISDSEIVGEQQSFSDSVYHEKDNIKGELLNDFYNEASSKIGTIIEKYDNLKGKSYQSDSEVEQKIEPKTDINNQLKDKSIFSFNISQHIKDFFSTNLLAKVGGILVFAGMIFFLSLIYGSLSVLGKFVIGLMLGIGVFVVGVVLNNKGVKNEGRIVMGVGIMINYIVILGGRYVLKTGDISFLSPIIALLYMIINTVLAVITSLKYKSGGLLFFSFFFAYLNPILIGGDATSPYMLLVYTLIVSLGVVIVSLKTKNDLLSQKSLMSMAFIGFNILTYLAPFSDSYGWIAKISLSVIFSLSIIYILFKINENSEIVYYFVLSYIFLGLGIFDGSRQLIGKFADITLYLLNLFFVGGLFIGSLFLFIKGLFKKGVYIFFIPFILLIYIFFTFYNIANFSYIYLIIPGLYFLIFLSALFGIFVLPSLGLASSVLFMILNFITSGFLIINGLIIPDFQLSNIQFVAVVIPFILFFTGSIYFGSRKQLEYLPLIGLMGIIVLVSPLLSFDSEYLFRSLTYLIVLMLILFATPFLNQNLAKNSSQVLISMSYSSYLYILIQILILSDAKSWGLLDLGLAVSTLGLLYLLVSFGLKFFYNANINTTNTQDKGILMVLFNYFSIFMLSTLLGVGISLDNNIYIMPYVVWFMVICYILIYNYIKAYIMLGFAFLFVLIGAVYNWILIYEDGGYNYSLLILLVILLAMFLSSWYLASNIQSKYKTPLFSINLILMMILSGVVGYSFHNQGFVIGVSIFLLLVGLGLHFHKNYSLQKFLGVILMLFLLYNIVYLFDYSSNPEYWYIVMLLNIASVSYLGFCNQGIKQSGLKGLFLLGGLIYVFLSSSIIVSNYFQDNFVLSMYRGIYACGFLILGISLDKKVFRTLGLYFLSLTVIKLGLYDIILSETSTVTKVMAFMILGFVLIGISIYYSKKYGNNLKGEWNVGNLGLKSNDEPNYNKYSGIKLNQIYLDDIFGASLRKISKVEFSLQNGDILTSGNEYIIKVSKFIVDKTKKNFFQPNELINIYDYFKLELESRFSSNTINDFDKYLSTFVKQGGVISFK